MFNLHWCPFLFLDVLEPFFREMFTISTAQLFSFESFKNMFDWFSLTFIEYKQTSLNKTTMTSLKSSILKFNSI